MVGFWCCKQNVDLGTAEKRGGGGRGEGRANRSKKAAHSWWALLSFFPKEEKKEYAFSVLDFQNCVNSSGPIPKTPSHRSACLRSHALLRPT